MNAKKSVESKGLLDFAQKIDDGMKGDKVIHIIVRIGIAIGLILFGLLVGWMIWGRKDTPKSITVRPSEVSTTTSTVSLLSAYTESSLTNVTYTFNFNNTQCEVCDKNYCRYFNCTDSEKTNGTWMSNKFVSIIRWINTTTFRAEKSFNARLHIEAIQSQTIKVNSGMVISVNGKRYIFGLFGNRPLELTSRKCSRKNAAKRFTIAGREMVIPEFVCEFDVLLNEGDDVTVDLVGERLFKFFIDIYPLRDEQFEEYQSHFSNYAVRNTDGVSVDQTEGTNEQILIQMVKARINVQEKIDNEKLTFDRPTFVQNLFQNLR